MFHNQVHSVGNTDDRKIDYCSFKWREEGRSPRTTVEDFGEMILKLKWKGKLTDVRKNGQVIGFSLLIKGDNVLTCFVVFADTLELMMNYSPCTNENQHRPRAHYAPAVYLAFKCLRSLMIIKSPHLHLIIEVRSLSLNTLPTARVERMQLKLFDSWAFALYSFTVSSFDLKVLLLRNCPQTMTLSINENCPEKQNSLLIALPGQWDLASREWRGPDCISTKSLCVSETHTSTHTEFMVLLRRHRAGLRGQRWSQHKFNSFTLQQPCRLNSLLFLCLSFLPKMPLSFFNSRSVWWFYYSYSRGGQTDKWPKGQAMKTTVTTFGICFYLNMNLIS